MRRALPVPVLKAGVSDGNAYLFLLGQSIAMLSLHAVRRLLSQGRRFEQWSVHVMHPTDTQNVRTRLAASV